MSARKQILIVDDEENVVFFLREALAGLGDFDVAAVRSGQEALQQVTQKAFDLLITDLRMPGLDGLQLLAQVRQLSPATRLILMTAYGTPQVYEEARRLQVSHCLAKPFRTQDLISIVQQALVQAAASEHNLTGFSDQRYESLTQILNDLARDIGAEYVLLSDATAHLIGSVGAVRQMDLSALLSLVAGEHAASIELSRRMGQTSGFNMNFHEGESQDITSAAVSDQLVLGIVFPRQKRSNNVGMVWLYIRRAVQRLRDIMAQEDQSLAPLHLEDDFQTSLDQQVDALFAPALSPGSPQTESALAAAPAPAVTARPAPAPASEIVPPPSVAQAETVYKLLSLEASRERFRLAREIHDGPTQVLVSAIMRLDYLKRMLDREPTKAREELATLDATFRQGVEELRRFTFDLRLPSLDAMSLVEALQQLCGDFQKRTKATVLIDTGGVKNRLPFHIEGAILRIVQEALHNIQKHAGARVVKVSLWRDSGNLMVSVADNGRGFDTRKAGSRDSGIGLSSMRERAQSINGSLNIESYVGMGTRVLLAMPLSRQ